MNGTEAMSIVVVVVVGQTFRSISSKLLAVYFLFSFIHSHSYESDRTEDGGVIAVLY